MNPQRRREVSFPLEDRTPVAESLQRLERLVSPFTGLVRAVDLMTYGPDDPRLFRFACSVASDASIIGVDHSPITTSGQHYSRVAARAAALAEAAERYSAFYVPLDRVRLSTAEDADFPVARPESFALFSDAQYSRPDFPFEAFGSGTLVEWIDGFWVADGEQVFVPVQRVYIKAIEHRVAGEAAITHATTNGMASGATRDEALLAGLLEVIERDALMIAWYNRLTLPHLDWRSDPELAAFDDAYFRVSGLACDAVDLSAIAGVPSVLACVRGGEDDLGAMGFGAAAALDVRDAWRRAVSEAFFTRVTGRDLHYAYPDRTFGENYADIVGFDDHMHFYAHAENLALVEFLFASDEFVPPQPSPKRANTVRRALDHLVSVVESQGGEVLAVDITAPEIQRLGVRVVKVIVPHYCDLVSAHTAPFLGGSRLYNRAYDVRIRRAPLEANDINSAPHPMG